MIISRTPFRITLGGGGTDLPSFYTKYGGFVVSATINKYMYISAIRSIFENCIRIKYSKTEEVTNIEELKHDIARETLKLMDISAPIEITSMADLPAGSGLGSSSSYTVGLLNVLHNFKREYISTKELAEEACKLEIDILKKTVGKQDQYTAAYGGFIVLDIEKSGKVNVRKVNINENTIDDLNQNLLIFYTNHLRSAETILSHQSKMTEIGDYNVIDSLLEIKEIGYNILESLENGNIVNIGYLFDKHWNLKKKMSNDISNPDFDKIYQYAKNNGALGGKIMGAGGGGFFIFYTEDKSTQLKEAMKSIGLKEMKYKFSFSGSRIIYDFTD